MPDLSPRQRDLLAYVARCTETNGYQPSYREIAAHFGWSSAGYCTAIVHRLDQLGIACNKGSRALSFDWKSYLKEQKHDAKRTDGRRSRRVPRRHVR
jgi:SOS-response transcriptional repressor LexA